MTTELATLGGGCFWCLEAVFEQLKGVSKVESGYAGGQVSAPSYEQVCTGRTGHAEVVQLTFDPSVITFRDILDVFFTMHDPTTLNRQGADTGTQYRSIIFTHSDRQRAEALEAIGSLTADAIWPDSLVTEVVPFTTFYPATAEHQTYYRRNAGQRYCQVVIAPKLAALRAKHFARLKA